MRNSELFEGVEVFKKNGEVVGVSKKAARQVSYLSPHQYFVY
jgi:hypothetical protein